LSVHDSLVYPQRANTVVFLSVEPNYHGTSEARFSFQGATVLFSHMEGKAEMGWCTPRKTLLTATIEMAWLGEG
jgi:hypothetical protein